MKKAVIISALLMMSLIGMSQGIFKPVAPFALKYKSVGAMGATQNYKWEMRFDATVQLSEVVYNKASKVLETNAVLGIGPAVGIQHYVPNEAGEAFNNYGFSAAVLLGERMKIALQANLMQYFKIGFTVTPNPAKDIFPVGLFFGGGITF